MQKVDRTGKKYAYYINTNEIQNQVSVRAKTSYLHACKSQRHQGYMINLAFVRAGETTKTCFREIFCPLRSLVKYFQQSKRTFVSLRGHVMPSVYIFCSICSIPWSVWGAGGALKALINTGAAPPRGPIPYPFIYHLWQKRYPFRIPFIDDKWYPLVRNLLMKDPLNT